MNRKAITVFLGAVLAALPPAAAFADATRTYVSNNGNDANSAYSCDYAHPCRTFAVALGQTVAGGEILAIDSSGYGRVTIDRSVSIIAAPGVYAGIGVGSAGNATGVQIATAGVNVVLRGLTINGMGGTYGVSMTNGSKLSVENCVIANFPGGSSAGLFINTPATVRIVDTLIRDSTAGLNVAGGATVDISNSKFLGNATAIGNNGIAAGTTTVAVSDSVVTGSSNTGIMAYANNAATTVRIEVVRTVVSNGFDGISASSVTGTSLVSVSDSMVTGNSHFGLVQGGAGATLKSVGNNTVADNGTNTSGVIASLPPM